MLVGIEYPVGVGVKPGELIEIEHVIVIGINRVNLRLDEERICQSGFLFLGIEPAVVVAVVFREHLEPVLLNDPLLALPPLPAGDAIGFKCREGD